MGPLVRSYVGIRIPGSFWPKFQEVQMAIRKKAMSDAVRWNTAAEITVPLLTLSEQPWEMIKRASTMLGPTCARHPVLKLKLEGLVGVPNNTQPRFVDVQVQGDVDELKGLQADIARAVAPLLSPSEKAYQPMVSLGRLKQETEQNRTALGRAVRMIPTEPLGEWTASEVELLVSRATSAGVSLETVEKFPLAAPVASA